MDFLIDALLWMLWWLGGKASTCNAGDSGLIPGLATSTGGGHDNMLQYSCQENPMDRGAWWPRVHRGCRESDTTEQLTLSLLLPGILSIVLP